MIELAGLITTRRTEYTGLRAKLLEFSRLLREPPELQEKRIADFPELSSSVEKDNESSGLSLTLDSELLI